MRNTGPSEPLARIALVTSVTTRVIDVVLTRRPKRTSASSRFDPILTSAQMRSTSGEGANVAPPEPFEALDEGHARPVEAREPFEELGRRGLDATNAVGVYRPGDSEAPEDQKGGLDGDVVEQPDVDDAGL